MKNKVKRLLAIIMVVVMTVCVVPMKEFRLNASAKNPFSTGQCTWYAYKRWTELLGYEPKIISGNAGGWYDNCISAGFSRGSSPQVGAIVCWNNGVGTDAGHVAIVETVSSSSITVSEYNWNVSLGYGTRTISFSNINCVSSSRPNRYLKGYIYLPGNTTTSNNPTSTLESISGGAGYVNICGWSFDRDDLNSSVELHVYIGGPSGVGEAHGGIYANQSGVDVNNVFGCGNYHRFNANIYTSKTGNQEVYVYAINIGGGENPCIGHKTVNITQANGTLDLNGWLDGAAYGSIANYGTVDVYINGSLVANDVADFCKSYPAGTTYEIKDIKSVTGKGYNCVNLGQLKGTLAANTITEVRLNFGTITYTCSFDVNYDNIGMNLYKPTKSSKTVSGISYSYNSANCTMCFNGTLSSGGAVDSYRFSPEANATYAVTAKVISGTIKNGFIVIEMQNKDKSALSTRLCLDIGNSASKKWTVTSALAKEATYITTWLWNSVGKNLTCSNAVIQVKIEKIASSSANATEFSPNAVGITYKSSYGTLPTPTRTGYSFDGWFTSKDGGTKITSSSTYPATNQTLYAHWKAITSKVIFDANGGKCNVSSKDVTYKTVYGDLPVPTLADNEFLGWFTQKVGGTQYLKDTVCYQTSNQTLYAHWAQLHQHSYNPEITNPATCKNVGLMTYTCSCGDKYTEEIPKEEHKTNDWEIVSFPTEKNEGSKTKTCEKCKEIIYSEKIDKIKFDVLDEEDDIIINKSTKQILCPCQGYSKLLDQFSVTGCTAEIDKDYSSVGTGTIIDLLYEDNVIDSYKVVVFGDLTGDGYVDSFDASVIASVTNYEIEFNSDSPNYIASDLNDDGYIDAFDLSIILSASNFETEITSGFWIENHISNWVKETEVSDDSQIVFNKWNYLERESCTDDQLPILNWTTYETNKVDYYKYYRYANSSGTAGSSSQDSTYNIYESITLTKPLTEKSNFSDEYKYYYEDATTWCIMWLENSWQENEYYRDVEKESVTYPQVEENISEITHYVKYIK